LGCSCWWWAGVWGLDRPSAACFEVGQDEQGAQERVEFLYAIHPTTASGIGASVLPDGTVMIGWETDEVRAFPSLDHFIECDALLALAGSLTAVENVYGDKIDRHLSELRAQRPTLRLVQEASGYTSQWWEDRQLLVHFTRTWADLWHTSQPREVCRSGRCYPTGRTNPIVARDRRHRIQCQRERDQDAERCDVQSPVTKILPDPGSKSPISHGARDITAGSSVTVPAGGEPVYPSAGLDIAPASHVYGAERVQVLIS
jgi:hypothetical protein